MLASADASSPAPMMDRHTCKVCFRRFSSGRALGGHMRSHVTFGGARVGGKTQLRDAASPSYSASASHGETEAPGEVAFQVADQAAAAALVAGREASEPVEEAKQIAYYGLRENPRKSYRLVDPEFSSIFPAVDYAAAAGVAGGGSSVVLLDRESETESSKPAPSLRRRSKRRRRACPLPVAKSEPSVEPEPVSSISDATPEEDVARCLMILSRDAWGTSSSPSPAAKRKRFCQDEEEQEEEEEEQNSDDDSEAELTTVVRSRRGGRSRYQCGTCRKVFRSYQALGGHRAGHKKVKACTLPPQPATPAVGHEEEEEDGIHPHLDNPIQDADSEVNAAPSTGSTDRRIHECSVCFRIFGSGQALGGHKRSHLAYSPGTATPSQAVETSPAAAAAAAPRTAATTTTASAAASAVSPTDANRTEKLHSDSFIDLNLPPPMDEEAETSAVCDGEH